MVTFGEWVRQQRQERRLTRQELSERVGISVAMLRKIEGDERRPSAQIAELLASAFGIPPPEQQTFVRVARGELPMDRLAREAPAADRSTSPGISQSSRHNIPIAPTPLIGRQRELLELARLARDPNCRLLTLVGPGGIGKTRLATELAFQLRDDLADGAYFVALASATSIALVVPMIADAVGFSFQRAGSVDPKAQLFNHLAGMQTLLVLDNVEQLLKEPGIELLAELLATAPGVRLLVTSREPLSLRAEWVFEVSGLPLPDAAFGEAAAQDTSVELFVQRARRAHAAFSATSADYADIRRICSLAEGVPLAIELAAAWVRTLTCKEIAAELEKSLDLLATPARDLPSRHYSMRAVFDHSWALLNEQEQRALARLSVFLGGFSRDAAAQVADTSLRTLSALVAKSLVRHAGEDRYDFHELIRQYASARLPANAADEADARQQHYAYYLRLAEASESQLKTSAQLQWIHLLVQEHQNLHEALDWSFAAMCDQDSEQRGAALQLAGALRWFWQMGSHYEEGCGYLRQALGTCPDEPSGDPSSRPGIPADDPAYRRARARALDGLALLENSLGHHAAAYDLAEESAGICRQLDDKQGLAEALIIMGQALRWRAERAAGYGLIEEALGLFEQTGDRWNAARALFHLGADLADLAGDDSGRIKLEQSQAILEALGDRFILLRLLVTRGIMAFTRGDYPDARSHFSRGLELAREIRDPWGMADALTNIGCVLRVQGDYVAAHANFVQALSVYEQWGRGPWCADALCALAENEMVQGNLQAAATYLEQAASYVHAPENKWLHVLVTYFKGQLAFQRGELEVAAASLEQTVELARAGQFKPDLARALLTLARTLGASAQVGRARLLNSEALALFAHSGCRLGIAMALETFASLAPMEKAARAARLLGAAEAIRHAIGAPLPPAERVPYAGTLATLRSCLGGHELVRARQDGRTEPYQAVVDEILLAFQAGQHTSPAMMPSTPPPRPSTALGSS